MDSYKREIAVLREKNVQSAINEKTALKVIWKHSVRLTQQVESNKADYIKIVSAFVVVMTIGFVCTIPTEIGT